MNFDLIHKALANPVRRQILQWLKTPDAYFSEQEYPLDIGVCCGLIDKRTGLSQSTVSAHLATLQRAERILEQSELKNMMFMRLTEPAIPFPDEYFDLVIAFGAYERFPTLDRVFDELSRVLKPEGKVYWHDVSTGLESVRDRLVHALFMGRRPSRAQQSLTAVRTKMSAYFTIEFHRRWTHTWGKQSCLLVGKKTVPVP